MNLTQAASIIDQITDELAIDNDVATRAAERSRMVERVEADAKRLASGRRIVSPRGVWADAEAINAKLRGMREAEFNA